MHKMKEGDPPRVVSDELRVVSVQGYVFPWIGNTPVFCAMHGTDDIALPLFSTPEKLQSYVTAAGIPYQRIQKITDAREFLDSIPYRGRSGERIRIMIDPWINEDGNTQFAEMLRADA